jgi:hypothetical protein
MSNIQNKTSDQVGKKHVILDSSINRLPRGYMLVPPVNSLSLINAKIRAEIKKSREIDNNSSDSDFDKEMTDADYKNAYLGTNTDFDD